MTPLETILAQYRAVSQLVKEKGTYFEELIPTYLSPNASKGDRGTTNLDLRRNIR